MIRGLSLPQARRRPHRIRRLGSLVSALLVVSVIGPWEPTHAQVGYQRITGGGSSWAANAIDGWRVIVQQFGLFVDYVPNGSTSGRKDFLNGTVDFAASDLPFQVHPEAGSAPEIPAPGSYAYIPATAGGVSFIYNLEVNGQPVTNLRLSGENVAKIFTGVIRSWNDPALLADNPGIALPARPIVPVVRSDGAGTTSQFTRWMIDRHVAIWDDYCQRSGRAPACGATSFYPTIPGMLAQSGDIGVVGYISQAFADGTIGYTNYSYALGVGKPVAKVLNAAGFYTAPTPSNVAVSLLQAEVNNDASNPATYLTADLERVYIDTDPRNYQLSGYSYFIVPTRVQGQFDESKGRSLGAFLYYAMCQGQQLSSSLGYSPLPINLVQASFDQIVRIPGVEPQGIDIAGCGNPTFSPDGTNLLAAIAPLPPTCDRQGQTQCGAGTTPPPSSGIVFQDIDVTRPAGALVLTQVCGAHGMIPAEAASTGFPGGLAEVSARLSSTVGDPTIPSDDPSLSVPTLSTGGGPIDDADPNGAGYPYPTDADDIPNPTYPTHCGIDLGRAAFVARGQGSGQFFATTGILDQVTVVDTRDEDLGWNVSGIAGTFAANGDSDTFSGSQLGWSPVLTDDTGTFTDSSGNPYDQIVSAGNVIAPNTLNSAGLGTGGLLGGAQPGAGLGVAILDARLKLLIPLTADAGVYEAALTLTVI